MRSAAFSLLLCGLVLGGPADEAAALIKKGEPRKAAEIARKAVAKDPADVASWLVLADALVAAGTPADAWDALENAMEANPGAARLSVKLGDVFVKMAELEQAGSNDGTRITNYYLDAERNYAEALKKDPKLADAIYGQAFVNFWLGRDETKEKARKLIADCLGLDPNHAKAHALQGYILYLDKKYPEAQAKYEIALKLDDSDPVDHVRYGHTFYGQGKWEEAKKAYIGGLKRHPADDIVIRSGLYHLANREANPKSWTNLQPYLEEAVKEAPNSAPAWYYLGYCHFAAERWEKALDAFGRADKLAPGNATYLFNLGYAQEKLGREKESLDLYRKTLAAQPDHAQATERFYQVILVRHPNIAEAEPLFEELIKLAPNTGWLHNDYALILRNWAEAQGTHKQKNPPSDVKRRLNRSGEVYEIAARLDPDTAQILSDTGLLFEFYPCNFDAAKAKRYFTAALDRSDYAYRDAFDGLNRLCRATGDWATLEQYADLVVESLEGGSQAIAPMGGGPPQAWPNETPGLKARAQAALKEARKNLKKKE